MIQMNWATLGLLVVALVHAIACVDQLTKKNYPMAINLFGLVIADTAFAFMAK